MLHNDINQKGNKMESDIYLRSINEASKHGAVMLEYYPGHYNNLIVSGIPKEDEIYVLKRIEAIGGYKLSKSIDNIGSTHVRLILEGVSNV